LVLGNHVTVELIGGVGYVVIQLGIALDAGALVAMGDEPARLIL
jgi:hypothetical protein